MMMLYLGGDEAVDNISRVNVNDDEGAQSQSLQLGEFPAHKRSHVSQLVVELLFIRDEPRNLDHGTRTRVKIKIKIMKK